MKIARLFALALAALLAGCMPGIISSPTFPTPSQAPNGEGGGSGAGGGTVSTGGGVGQGGGAPTGGGTGVTPKPSPIPPHFVPGDCNLDQPAFCENFETDNPGGRGGGLDEKVWSFGRWGQPGPIGWPLFAREGATSHKTGLNNTPSFCGADFDNVLPPNDVKVCDGVDGAGFSSKQLHEVFNDSGGFTMSSMRIRQPFDFTDRTGTIVFDVDAKRNTEFDGHGWWIEVWITPDPTPMPYHGAPTVGSIAKNAVGFQIAPVDNSCFMKESPICNQVGRVVIERDYEVLTDRAIGNNNPVSTADQVLNRFKMLVSKNRIEFWGSNHNEPGQMKKLVEVDNLNLDFTVGYIHFQHAQYNADKAHASSSQTYRWDNIGFDGPTYPTPRGYDVDKFTTQLSSVLMGLNLVLQGHPPTPVQATAHGVDLTDAIAASMNFNYAVGGGRQLQYRFNNGTWHTFTTPTQLDGSYVMRTFSIPVELAELVTGDNAIEMKVANANDAPEAIGNLDLTIEISK